MSRRLAILTAQLQNRPLWETVPGNPLVQRNRETGMLRAVGLTEISINTNGPISDRTERMPLQEKSAAPISWMPSWIKEEWTEIPPRIAKKICNFLAYKEGKIEMEFAHSIDKKSWEKSQGRADLIPENAPPYRVRLALDDLPF